MNSNFLRVWNIIIIPNKAVKVMRDENSKWFWNTNLCITSKFYYMNEWTY